MEMFAYVELESGGVYVSAGYLNGVHMNEIARLGAILSDASILIVKMVSRVVARATAASVMVIRAGGRAVKHFLYGIEKSILNT
jgi:hypothetical protein